MVVPLVTYCSSMPEASTPGPMTQFRPMRTPDGISTRLPMMVMPEFTMSGRSRLVVQSSP